uniref:PH01B001E05.16 protein n=1 Tax=Phyllostachys edulis TaxID=38705 RepID=L0P295_PHYED|nr:PH01B001E05.16 [Phyllostachys edulis]
MLKDIGQFEEVAGVVKVAKRICRFLYNHSRLHNEMREQIRGEIVRPNATRKDKFMKRMISNVWRSNHLCMTEEGEYMYSCLTSRQWWSSMDWVIKVVEPIYRLLRFVDQQKPATVEGMIAKIYELQFELKDILKEDQATYAHVIENHNLYDLGKNAGLVVSLTKAIQRIADTPDEAMQSLGEKTIGKIHVGKRKYCSQPTEKLAVDFASLTQTRKLVAVKKKKRVIEEDTVGSDEETKITPSDEVQYQESGDSSSPSFDDGADDGTAHDAVQDQQNTCQPLEFTCRKNFTHATQDEDHGCHASRTINKTYRRANDHQQQSIRPTRGLRITNKIILSHKTLLPMNPMLDQGLF